MNTYGLDKEEKIKFNFHFYFYFNIGELVPGGTIKQINKKL